MWIRSSLCRCVKLEFALVNNNELSSLQQPGLLRVCGRMLLLNQNSSFKRSISAPRLTHDGILSFVPLWDAVFCRDNESPLHHLKSFHRSSLPQLDCKLQLHFPQEDTGQVLTRLLGDACYHLAGCADHHPLYTQEIHQAPVAHI